MSHKNVAQKGYTKKETQKIFHKRNRLTKMFHKMRPTKIFLKNDSQNETYKNIS